MASNFLVNGTDLDDLLEPIRSGFTTQTADANYLINGDELTDFYLRKDYSRQGLYQKDSDFLEQTTNFHINGEDIGGSDYTGGNLSGYETMFCRKGYAPGARSGVYIAYTSDTSITISDLAGVSGADFLDYDTLALNVFMVGAGGNGGNGGGDGEGGGGGGGSGAVFIGQLVWPNGGATNITVFVFFANSAFYYNYLSTGYGYETGNGNNGGNASGATGGSAGTGGTIVASNWDDSGVAYTVTSTFAIGKQGGAGGDGTTPSDGGGGTSALTPAIKIYDLLGDGTENAGKGWDYINNIIGTTAYDVTHGLGGSAGAKYEAVYPAIGSGGGGGGGGGSRSINNTANGGDGNGNAGDSNSGAGGGGGRGYSSQAGGSGGNGYIVIFY